MKGSRGTTGDSGRNGRWEVRFLGDKDASRRVDKDAYTVCVWCLLPILGLIELCSSVSDV